MKFAYMVSRFPSLSETFILSQITGLLDLGHQVDIYALRPGKDAVQHPDIARYHLMKRTRYQRDIAEVHGRFTRLARGAAILARTAVRDPGRVRQWLGLLRRQGAFRALNLLFAAAPFWRAEYDVIVTHFGPTGNAWLWLKAWTRAKYTCAFYGYDVTRYPREHGPDVYRELFRQGDLFFALSRHMAGQLEALGCDPTRLIVHPIGIDVGRFAPRGTPRALGGPLRLLSVARLVEKKGLADAIEAVGRAGVGVEYAIVGSGALEDALRGLIRARGLEGRVTLAGPKPSDEVAALMAQADVFLLPSVTAPDGDQEGTPTVLMEAQACNVPVLSTWHSGIPEIVADGQSGYLVPEHDVDALADRLKFLAEHPDVRAQLGAFGRRYVAERFDTQRLCRRLAGVFETLVASGRVDIQEAASPVPAPAAAVDMTVIMPTRNRASRVREMLECLSAQKTDGHFTFEALIVDNGSTDETPAVVERLRASFPVTLRYLYEGHAGKSYALNAGIEAAAGEILVVLDDDVVVSPTWLHALWTCFMQEQADAVCGRVLPVWTGPLPDWFDEEVRRHLNHAGLGCKDHGPARRRTADGQDCRWVGGNMAIRREGARRAGGFHLALVRGQDSEYYERCVSRGLRVVYEPEALSYHQIGPERLSKQAFRQWRHRQGYYEAMLLPWKVSHVVTIMPLWRWATTLKALGVWLAARFSPSRWERFYTELKLREQIGGWAYRLQHWPGRKGRAHG